MRSFVTPSPLVTVMARAVFAAAKGLIRDFGEIEQLQVSCKGVGNFASIADRRVERSIYETLHDLYPESNFLMEEMGSVRHGPEDAFLWIIDPIDGTRNFLHGVPHCAISIALKEKKGITAGLIYDPLRDEIFWAAKGCGAFLNHTRLRVSRRSHLSEGLVAVGGSAFKYFNEAPLKKLFSQGTGVRLSGSLALDLAYVAAGRYDGCLGYQAASWGVAAGIILLSEAGGFMTDHQGKSVPLEGGHIVAGNEHIHPALLHIVMSEAS